MSDAGRSRHHDLGSGVHAVRDDEARSLLAVVAGHRLESLYTVAISHGIRMSEAIGAQWSYVDLSAGASEVWPTLTRTMEGDVVEGGTKNRRRRRFVLTATAVEQLNVHKRRLARNAEPSEMRGPSTIWSGHRR